MRVRLSIFTTLMLSKATSACLSAGSTTTATTTEATGDSSAMTATGGTDGMSSTSADTTTTPTTATTSETTDDSTSTGCSFVCGPDAGPEQPEECDIWEQDCPEGEKCNAWANDGGGAWNSTKCVPVDPDPDDVHEPCTVMGSGVSGFDSCVKGAMCWDVDPETNTGVCVQLCQGSPVQCTRDPASCCPPGGTCTTAAASTLILCLQNCDPIAQDCWGRSDVCYPVANSFSCAPDVSGDMGAVGDPCEFINACDPGTFCGNPMAYPGCDPMAGGCCIPFCLLDAPDCVAGTECEPWYDPMDVPPGYENLGACVIP